MDSTDAETKQLAARIKALRQIRKLTLSQMEKLCGVGASTVSKIERGAISPSYATLLRLAKGLNIELSELVQRSEEPGPKTRRAVTRKGEGLSHSIGSHDYQFLCAELKNKKMTPMLATVHAREFKEIGAVGDQNNGMFSHDGEEVMYVVSGEVTLYTEFYSPVTLKPGDCAYIDSTMGHVCLKGAEEDAVVFWVCTDVAFKPDADE